MPVVGLAGRTAYAPVGAYRILRCCRSVPPPPPSPATNNGWYRPLVAGQFRLALFMAAIRRLVVLFIVAHSRPTLRTTCAADHRGPPLPAAYRPPPPLTHRNLTDAFVWTAAVRERAVRQRCSRCRRCGLPSRFLLVSGLPAVRQFYTRPPVVW